VTVQIQDFTYKPQVILIATGSTVIWTNYDAVPHTVTSSDSGPLDSGTLNLGESYWHTFSTPGIYPYFCQFHPWMTGRVVVVDKMQRVYLPVVLKNHTGRPSWSSK